MASKNETPAPKLPPLVEGLPAKLSPPPDEPHPGANGLVETQPLEDLRARRDKVAAEVAEMKERIPVTEYREAVEYLEKVAAGEVPYDPVKGHETVKVNEYTHHLLTLMTHQTGVSRKQLMGLAVSHFARSITSSTCVTLNDLAVHTKGTQAMLEELTCEVTELAQLALEVANQEAVSGIGES